MLCGLYMHHPNIYLFSYLLCVSVSSPFLSLIRTYSCDLGPTLIQSGPIPILTSSTSAKTSFPIRSDAEILGEHELWEDTMKPTTESKAEDSRAVSGERSECNNLPVRSCDLSW